MRGARSRRGSVLLAGRVAAFGSISASKGRALRQVRVRVFWSFLLLSGGGGATSAAAATVSAHGGETTMDGGNGSGGAMSAAAAVAPAHRQPTTSEMHHTVYTYPRPEGGGSSQEPQPPAGDACHRAPGPQAGAGPLAATEAEDFATSEATLHGAGDLARDRRQQADARRRRRQRQRQQQRQQQRDGAGGGTSSAITPPGAAPCAPALSRSETELSANGAEPGASRARRQHVRRA